VKLRHEYLGSQAEALHACCALGKKAGVSRVIYVMSMNSQPVFDVKGMVFVVVIKYAVDDKPHMILPPGMYDCKGIGRGVGEYQWWVILPTIRGLPACVIVTTVTVE